MVCVDEQVPAIMKILLAKCSLHIENKNSFFNKIGVGGKMVA
jgi:hypothetical protein